MRNLDATSKNGNGRVPGIVSGTRLRRPHRRSLLRGILAEQDGQMIAWAGLMMTVMIGTGAIVVDVANAMVVQHQLQSSTDAAAIAAAEALSNGNSNFATVGTGYSGASGDANSKNYTITGPTIVGKCLTTVSNWGLACNASTSDWNAVAATETATVNTYFGWILGKKTITVSATSWATKGSVPLPYNVAIIVDSTLSMDSADTNCNNLTQMQCALNGVQALLQTLNPSTDHVALFTFPNVTYGSTAGTATSGNYNCTTTMPSSYTPSGGQTTLYQHDNSFGYYSMVQESTRGSSVTYETPWPGAAWAMPYTFPSVPAGASGYNPPTTTYGATYEVVPFSTDYRTSATATTLNSSSNLVKAAGGVSGCNGIGPSNYDGDFGTYYAGALYAAQAALLKEQTLNAGSQNAIVLLGDGNSNSPQSNGGVYPIPSSTTQETTTYLNNSNLTNSAYIYPSGWPTASSSGSYPSWVGECGQAVDAAQYAATYSGNRTRVYTVAYGALTTSSTSNCKTDRTTASSHPNISPCQTLQQMATGSTSTYTSDYFYSDYNVPGGDAGCVANSTNSAITNLNQIFKYIGESFTSVRLIPVGTN